MVEAYGAWCGKLGDRHLGGDKLTDEPGRIARKSASGISVTDGPYVETKEVLGGYFLIEANGYDEAVALLEDCPHLENGSIEVREVEELEGH